MPSAAARKRGGTAKSTRAAAVHGRERHRTEETKAAFALLRSSLSDWLPPATKLSKQRLLLAARLRVRYLAAVLVGDERGARQALDELCDALPWVRLCGRCALHTCMCSRLCEHGRREGHAAKGKKSGEKKSDFAIKQEP